MKKILKAIIFNILKLSLILLVNQLLKLYNKINDINNQKWFIKNPPENWYYDLENKLHVVKYNISNGIDFVVHYNDDGLFHNDKDKAILIETNILFFKELFNKIEIFYLNGKKYKTRVDWLNAHPNQDNTFQVLMSLQE